MALSPWNLIYSRISFEVITLVVTLPIAITLFIRGIKKPNFLVYSSLFFGLTLYTYSTAKLFVPLICVSLVVLYFSKVLSLPKKTLLISCLLLILVATPLYFDTLFGTSAGRFHNVSIFTNPVIPTTVNQERFESTISRLDGNPRVGLSPNLVDKLLYNRPTSIAKAFFGNYFSAFSVDFLLLKGDPLIRHSPDKSWYGQLNPIDILPIVLGLACLADKKFRFLALWLLLAPIPSALTRDGGMHASRLILMLPPLVILISLGFARLHHYSRLMFVLFSIAYTLTTFAYLGYYFTRYRLESAKEFNWGFSQIVTEAVSAAPNYDLVFIDTRTEWALMSYLYTTKFSPSHFHRLHPLTSINFSDGFTGFQFGNIIILQPGNRNWTDAKIAGNNLVISSADQPLLEKLSPKIKTINHPDQTPAFYFFLSNLSNPNFFTPK